jgi:hypothetical protein
MRRSSTFALASLLIASVALALPANAAKTPLSGASRGKVYVSISNDRYDSNRCSYKISGSNLAANHTLWADTSYDANNSYITDLGVVGPDGTVYNNNAYLNRHEFNRLYTTYMFTDGWGAILDIYGQPAAISISNNCAP